MTNEAKVLIGIGVATVAIVIGAALTIGGKSSATPTNTEPVANQEALIRSDSHVAGPKDAKVTLVEFGDFQCPACGAAHPVVQQLLNEYKGKVRFAFREFPLPMHQNAKAAAQAAESAGAQGKYFEMHDKLYENQGTWENVKDPTEIYVGYAEDLKLDINTFKEDLKTKKYEKVIQQGVDDGYAVGVDSTPTFFINGVKQDGGIQYDSFKTQFDAILKK